MSDENKEAMELSEGETLSTRTYSTDPSSISPILDTDWIEWQTYPSDQELYRSREEYLGKQKAMAKKKLEVKKEEVASTDGTGYEKKPVKRKLVMQEDKVETTQGNGSPKRKSLRTGPVKEEELDSADEEYSTCFNQLKKTIKGTAQKNLDGCAKPEVTKKLSTSSSSSDDDFIAVKRVDKKVSRFFGKAIENVSKNINKKSEKGCRSTDPY